MTVPIQDDAAYWRQMYEERVALQEEGFTALLADRDRYRAALEEIARHPLVERNPDGEDQAAHTMRLIAREVLAAGSDEGTSHFEPLYAVGFDWLELMGTLAALRAVIDSAPAFSPPEKLLSAVRKIIAVSKRDDAAPSHGEQPR